jgi:hypothetical protein
VSPAARASRESRAELTAGSGPGVCASRPLLLTAVTLGIHIFCLAPLWRERHEYASRQ